MEVLSALRSADWWRRFAQLNLGLLIFGIGIGLMLRAGIGVDPWSTFHEGVSINTALSFGRVTQLTGVLIVGVSWLWLGERPGVGTVCNMAFVGPWVDFFRPHTQISALVDLGLAGGIVQFMIGVGLVGLASGLYIAARHGAGPRDAFILGTSQQLGVSVRVTRIGLEIVVLTIGWLLGGPVGLGTVLFAFSMGPAMQASLKLFRYDHAEELAARLEAANAEHASSEPS